jgi:hypothetical protein
MRNRPGLLPKSVISSGAEDHPEGGIAGSLAGAGILAAAIADAAFRAVRMVRRAIRNSRDHFIVGQHSCRSCCIRACCVAAKGLGVEKIAPARVTSPRRPIALRPGEPKIRSA